MHSLVKTTVIFAAIISFAGCTTADVPESIIQGSRSSTIEPNTPAAISSSNNNSTYSIENITKEIKIGDRSYDKITSQKLIRIDPQTGSTEVIIDNLENDLNIHSAGTPTFQIVSQSRRQPGVIFFLVLGGGPDTVAYILLKYNTFTNATMTSPLENLFNSKHGDFIQIGSSAKYLWAPFMDGGIKTDDRVIFLVDFETETSSAIVSLPETETLDGADHCDRFNFITDITATNEMLKYAVYSRTKLDELYADACSGNGDEELQKENAQKAFIEYRTLNITESNS